MRIRHLAFPLLAAAPLALALPAGADAGGANNVVLTQPAAVGTTVARSALQVSSTGAPAITSSNLAEALNAQCSAACHAASVAVQVVFVERPTTSFTPTNAAVAVNAGCTGCTATAYAWQDVVSTDGPASLSPAGRAAVDALRQQIAQVTQTYAAQPFALGAAMDTLTAQLAQVVQSDLVSHGVAATSTARQEQQTG